MENIASLSSEVGKSPLMDQANSFDMLPLEQLNAPLDADAGKPLETIDAHELKGIDIPTAEELNKPILNTGMNEASENVDEANILPQDETSQSDESSDVNNTEKTNKETDTPKSYEEMCEERNCGGSYKDVKNEGWGWNDNPPTEVHHMPADSASNLERADGPAIAMEYEDHQQTASCGNSREAQEYRARQQELIEKGNFREAMQMDIDDIKSKFGDKYDEAISQMLTYVDELEISGKI